MEETFVKIGEVEVRSKEWFNGIWYRAILEENPTKTRHKKLKVRYLTLFNDDGSTLTEMIDQKFIRPVPPVDLFEDAVVLEEGSVVDADHNDGWWSGVVVKKSEDENSFWVYFDFQPDIIRFERNQLRVHFDWICFKWVRPDTQELSKSEFSAGTMVEVSSVIDNSEVVWFPAMIIKEEKKKFTVKYCNNNGDEAIRPNETVDSHHVRPTPPVEEEVEYTLLDRVEAFRVGLGWRQGLVRGVLSEKHYVVGLEATKEKSVFKQSDLRPLQVWENGVWHNELKEHPVIKKQLKPITPITPKRLTNVMNPKGNGKTLLTKAAGEFGKKKNDEAPMLLTPPQVTSKEAKETHEKTLEPGKKNQNGGLRINDSTRNTTPEVEKKNSEDQSFTAWIRELSTGKGFVSPVTITPCGKRKREEETDISPAQTPVSAALANLPFEKKSPFWKICETLKCFKTVPHFSPLSNESNDIREWSAIGMSVTYLGLLEEVKKLRLDDDEDSITNRLISLSDSFDKLAKHGFDVETPQSRIRKRENY